MGVLVAGFYLVRLSGLPGTLLSAAMLNLLVAAATIGIIVAARRAGRGAERPPVEQRCRGGLQGTGQTSALERLLLFTAFGTAVASFIYEIAWIRMLALVLGSATHSFELMLSAFILGLALGAWWIRSRADRGDRSAPDSRPRAVDHGLLALATLPLYVASFGWIASLLSTFARNDSGYIGFTLARYGSVPGHHAAGHLLRRHDPAAHHPGPAEERLGRAGDRRGLRLEHPGLDPGRDGGRLVLLPLIGLKPMLIVGAAIDIGIGHSAALADQAGRRRAPPAGLRGDVLPPGTAVIVWRQRDSLDRTCWPAESIGPATSVPRTTGRCCSTATAERPPSPPRTPGRGLAFARHQRQAGRVAHPVWLRRIGDCGDSKVPLIADAGTQTLVPLITLAYAPQARNAAVIGQGSGMSSHLLLGSPTLGIWSRSRSSPR